MKKTLSLAVLTVVLVGFAFLVARAGAWSSPRIEVASPKIAPARESLSARSPQPLARARDEALPNQREASPPAAPATGTWVVRGHAFRRRAESYPGLALEGRVYRGPAAEGEPLIVTRFRADDAGDFAWPLEPPGELVTVHVSPARAEGMALPTWDVFLPGDPPPERFTVADRPLDCTVRGVVRDDQGRPVEGALVRARDRQDERGGVTDSEGRYLLHLSSENERRLRVFAPGYAQSTFTIDAREPGEIQAPDVVLAPELRIRGRVVDEDGKPLAGARVAPTYPYFSEAATSAADGTFELGTIASEGYLALEVSLDGYISSRQQIERESFGARGSSDARTQPIELRLARGTRVTGRVLDARGAPVWGAWISVGPSQYVSASIQAFSERDGSFALEQVPLGPQTLWASRLGFAQHVTPIEVSAEFVNTIELRLEEGHFLGGIVLDENGEPLPWALVYADDAESSPDDAIDGFQTYSGPDGRFRIEGLPPIAIMLGALAKDRSRLEQTVTELDRDDVELRMTRSAAFAGRVVDAVTGAPVRSFVVRVGFPAEQLRGSALNGIPAEWFRGVAFDDPQGRWLLEDDLEADRAAAIQIEAQGYAPVTLDAVFTAHDPDPDANVVRLVSGTLVRGRVVERESGAPVVGARVRRVTERVPFATLDDSGEPVPEAHTDAAGRFELRDVPTGSMGLVVEHPDWVVADDGPFEVTGVAPVERWIELGKGATLRGRLLGARGAPLPGERVSVSCLDGIERNRERATTTDAQGGYELPGLSSGEYHVRWERERRGKRFNDLIQYLALADGETREFDLRPCGQATLTGTLDFDGELPEIAIVYVMPKTPPRADGTHSKWTERMRTTVAERGTFTLTDLEAGEYTVGAHVNLAESGPAMGSVRVNVPESGTTDVRIRIERP